MIRKVTIDTDLNSRLTLEEKRVINLRIQKYEKDPCLRGPIKHLEAMIPTMPRSTDLLLKKIYTKNYWEPLDIGMRSYIGEYVACLVAAKRLPLILVGDRSNSNLYKKI